jgi:uncharacterized protein DUF6457
MTAEEWLERFAGKLGVEPPTRDEVDALLELASLAAHASERRAAPIACWLAASAGRTPEEAREAAAGLD